LQRRGAEPGHGALRAESAADLAQLLADEGRPAAAVAGLRSALDDLRRAAGERNALGVRIWRALGEAFGLAGNAPESEAAYRQALDIALSRFGANHPRTAQVQQELSGVLLAAGKLEEASRQAQFALDQGLGRLGPDEPRLRPLWQLRGEIAWERGRPADAEAAWAEAVRLGPRGAAGIPDRCRLAQAQIAARNSDAGVRDCLVAWPGLPAATREAAGLALAEVALDRGDVAAARIWLPPGESREPRDALLRARLALLEGTDPSEWLERLPVRPARGREKDWALRVQADALRAEWECRNDEPRGAALRARALDEAETRASERAWLRKRLDTWSASCR
jgi:serine/threonine-protein kinase